MKKIYYNEKPKFFDKSVEDENIYLKGFFLGFFLNIFGLIFNDNITKKDLIKKKGIHLGIRLSSFFLLILIICLWLVNTKNIYEENKYLKKKFGPITYVKKSKSYVFNSKLKIVNKKLNSKNLKKKKRRRRRKRKNRRRINTE